MASKAPAHPHEAPLLRLPRAGLSLERLKLTAAQKREIEERPDPFLDPWEEDTDAPDPGS